MILVQEVLLIMQAKPIAGFRLLLTSMWQWRLSMILKKVKCAYLKATLQFLYFTVVIRDLLHYLGIRAMFLMMPGSCVRHSLEFLVFETYFFVFYIFDFHFECIHAPFFIFIHSKIHDRFRAITLVSGSKERRLEISIALSIRRWRNSVRQYISK